MQPLSYHDVTGSNFCILKGECGKSQLVNDPCHKPWIILVSQGSVVSLHLYGGHGWNMQSVAGALFWVEAALRTGLANQSCTSFENEWLPCRKDI